MASGTFYIATNNQNISGYLEWSEYNQNIANNTSDISMNVYLHRTNNYSGTPSSIRNLSLTRSFYVGSDTISTTENVTMTIPNDKSYVLVASATKTGISHNADGTLSIGIGFAMSVSSGNSSFTVSRQDSIVTLDTIPRASSFNVSTGTIEGTLPITIYPASSNFRHTITYAFGNLTGTIATNVANSYTWNVPSSFYNQISTTATSGYGTMYVTTYNNGVQIGSTQSKTFTVVTSEAYGKPTINFTVVDSNATTIALTGDSSKLVLNASNALLTITEKNGRNNTTITGVYINGVSVSTSTNSYTINATTTNSFTIRVVNSRGYQNSKTVALTSIDYTRLTNSSKFYRVTQVGGTVKLAISGKYSETIFGNVTNSLTLTWKYKKKSNNTWLNGGTITPAFDSANNTYSYDQAITPQDTSDLDNGEFYYKNEYDFILYYNDEIVSGSVLASLTRGIGNLEIYKDVLLFNGKIINKLKLATAYFDDTVTINNRGIIALTKIDSNTADLTLSNDGIRIGGNISKVKVSANAFGYSTASTIYFWLDIKLNATSIIRSISSFNSSGYTSSVISPIILNVQEGDVLTLNKNDTNNVQIRGKDGTTMNTYLTVEVVD